MTKDPCKVSQFFFKYFRKLTFMLNAWHVCVRGQLQCRGNVQDVEEFWLRHSPPWLELGGVCAVCLGLGGAPSPDCRRVMGVARGQQPFLERSSMQHCSFRCPLGCLKKQEPDGFRRRPSLPLGDPRTSSWALALVAGACPTFWVSYECVEQWCVSLL